MSAPDWDVIVVGGGLCGVALAHEVESALGPGCRVLLLEASDELGGRARSRRSGDRSVDLGAHYFGHKHRRVRALADRVCPGATFERSAVYGRDPAACLAHEGRHRVTPRSRTVFDVQGLEVDGPLRERIAMLRSMSRYLSLEASVNVHAPWRTPDAEALDAMTFEQWIKAQAVPAPVEAMWRLACNAMISSPTDQTSMLYLLWYQASNGGLLFTASDYTGGAQEFALRCGVGGLVHGLASELLRTEIRLGTPVVGVEHGHDDIVRVRLESGGRETARAVVVAATPNVVHRKIAFEPALSAARTLQLAQPIGRAAKAICTYAEPFWHDSHGHHVMSWVGNMREGMEWGLDTSDPDGTWSSITFFVAPSLFDELGAGATPAQVDAALRAAAVAITGDSRAADATRLDVQRWDQEPWVGGGPNTVMGPGVLSRLEGTLGQPEGPHGRLFFASAEQSFEFTGYLEGALACAETTARAVLALLAHRDAVGTPPRPLRRPRAWTAPARRGAAAAAWAALVVAQRVAGSAAD